MNQQQTPHRGPLILVLGILSFFLCPFVGLVPWMLGNHDLAAMNAGQMDPEGRGLTQAGKLCGILSVALHALAVLLVLAIVSLRGSFGLLGT